MGEQGTGAELICSTPTVLEGEDWTVSPPNSCAFLCDKHHVVTIQSGWTSRKKGRLAGTCTLRGSQIQARLQMEKICPVGLGGYLDTIGGAEHGGGAKCSRI